MSDESSEVVEIEFWECVKRESMSESEWYGRCCDERERADFILQGGVCIDN